jgi:hypothetical protein
VAGTRAVPSPPANVFRPRRAQISPGQGNADEMPTCTQGAGEGVQGDCSCPRRVLVSCEPPFPAVLATNPAFREGSDGSGAVNTALLVFLEREQQPQAW